MSPFSHRLANFATRPPDASCSNLAGLHFARGRGSLVECPRARQRVGAFAFAQAEDVPCPCLRHTTSSSSRSLSQGGLGSSAAGLDENHVQEAQARSLPFPLPNTTRLTPTTPASCCSSSSSSPPPSSSPRHLVGSPCLAGDEPPRSSLLAPRQSLTADQHTRS